MESKAREVRYCSSHDAGVAARCRSVRVTFLSRETSTGSFSVVAKR
jgi:hypothetical protein